MSETLQIDELTFAVRRSARRRTLGLTVDRRGELVMHAPLNAGCEELLAWARTKLLWVHRKLALKQESTPKVRNPEYVTGETFSYLGNRYRLQLVASQDESLRFDGTRYLLRRDVRLADRHFRSWYIGAARAWLPKRVELLRKRTGADPVRVVVRDLGYRWGSCGRDGALYFNWRLLQLPVRVLDYVVVHELVHLIQPNHRPEFWKALGRALPDWRERKAELERQALDIYWCSPSMRT